MIEQYTEDPVAPSDAVLDSIAIARTRTSSSLRQHRPGQRLWALLHAQFLLRGPATSGDDIRLVEDDYQRMAVLRGQDTAEHDGQTRNTRQPRPAADCQPYATRRPSRCGGSKGLGVAAFVFEEDWTRPGSFKITTCGYGPGGPSLAKHLARQGCVSEGLGRRAGAGFWKWRPGRRARRQRRSEAEGCYLTGLMSAWQCDGPRRDGLLRSADVRDGPLIAQSLRGTPEAFVEIVRRHEVAIHGYLTGRPGLRAADDLLGEVWVRAFGARHRYDTSHEDARPWLYGIARNVLRAHGELART